MATKTEQDLELGAIVEPTAKADPLIGSRIGEYVVKERIGTGGAGIVYRGEHPKIGKPVAIKVLRPELARDPQQMRTLLDEAKVVNAIKDRGIVDVFGFGELPDGRQYMVMEYLQGDRLESLYRDKKLSVGQAILMLDQILRVLSAAHQAGVIHRDLKPQNIFSMKASDGARYIKLLDFGLALRVSQKDDPAGEHFAGSPYYMSPEQIRNEPLDARSDLYSAGAIGYELLTRTPPFTGATIETVIRAHLKSPPPSAKAVRSDVPPELDALLRRMLAKSAAERPANAEAVRAELTKIRRALKHAVKERGDRTEPELETHPMVAVPLPPELSSPSLHAAPSSPPSLMRYALLAAGALVVLLFIAWVITTAPGRHTDSDSNSAAAHTNDALVQRIDALTNGLQQQAVMSGRQVEPAALADLRRLRIEAVAAKGPLELGQVERSVNAWARKYGVRQ